MRCPRTVDEVKEWLILAERSAVAAAPIVARGEWPIGGSVFVAAHSPGAAAWER